MKIDRLTAGLLVFALLAYAALAVGYATLTPIWQNPDEPAHYNYVAYVAQTGGLPELKPGDWDSALLDRLKNGRLQPGDSVSAIRYEGWQPPLFYVLAAPVFGLGAKPDLDPTAAVFRLRALNVFIGALSLVVAYQVASEVLPNRLALGVPLVLVGVPMFTSVSAAISADPLANFLGACLLLCLVRQVQREPRADSRWAIGLGVLLGLGLLAKLALAIFVPLALIVVVRRATRPRREAAALLATSAVVTLPWLVHQVTTYGWFDPLATSRHAAVVVDQQRFPGLSAEYLVSLGTVTFHSFWAQFGWMGIVAPDRLYVVYGVCVAIAAIGLWLRRRALGEPAWRLMLLVLGVAVLAYLGYNLSFVQFQGRYLFTALVPIAALLVAGWAAWLPGRAQMLGVVLVALVLVGLNGYALTRVLVPGFGPST